MIIYSFKPFVDALGELTWCINKLFDPWKLFGLDTAPRTSKHKESEDIGKEVCDQNFLW